MTAPSDEYEEFVRLLIREESAVKAYVRGLVPTWQDVEEVVQQTSLVAWKKFSELDDVSRFGGWLMTIARYEALKYRRSLARSPLVFSEPLTELLADLEKTSVSVSDRRTALEECLQKLSAAHRELVLRAHTPGITIRDFANAQGKSEAAIYKLVQRLRHRLWDCVRSKLIAEELP